MSVIVFLYDAGTKREPTVLECQKQWLLELEDIQKVPGDCSISKKAILFAEGDVGGAKI